MVIGESMPPTSEKLPLIGESCPFPNGVYRQHPPHRGRELLKGSASETVKAGKKGVVRSTTTSIYQVHIFMDDCHVQERASHEQS